MVDILKNKFLVSLKKGSKIYLSLSLVFLSIALYFFTTYWHFTPENFGYSLVSPEITASDSFLYAKPITLIVIFAFLFYAFLLEFLFDFFKVIRKEIKFLLSVLSFVLMFLYLFELFWQSVYWSSRAAVINATSNSNYDSLTFPSTGLFGSKYPANIVYINKIDLLFFSLAAYTLYFLLRVNIATKNS